MTPRGTGRLATAAAAAAAGNGTATVGPAIVTARLLSSPYPVLVKRIAPALLRADGQSSFCSDVITSLDCPTWLKTTDQTDNVSSNNYQAN